VSPGPLAIGHGRSPEIRLDHARIALADNAKALRENEQVRKTYLGED
jgi:hypothetical protein